MSNSSGKMDLYSTLTAMEDKYRGDFSIGGPSLMSYGQVNDSARMIMFNNHLKQFVTPNESEFPRVFTNFENMFGEHSSYNKVAKHDLEVLNIISKFDEIGEVGNKIQLEYYFTLDKETGVVDVIERKDVENLTEKYGFQFDNSEISKYGVGDIIHAGDTIKRPTSFDEYGDYGYGKNIPFMYISNCDTLEDGLMVSESLSKTFTSTEVEEVVVSLNDNDFLLNIYGNEDHYKSFPDIGESVVDKRLCVIRRIIKSQMLFDFKLSNADKILTGDVEKYISGMVVDIDVYCNKPYEEIPKTIFNRQLLQYLEMSNRFHDKMYKYTTYLLDTYGELCTDNIRNLHKRSDKMINPNLIKKDELNNAFSFMKLYFTVKRPVGLFQGQKLTGRSGNKGVIAKIVPDREMPHIVCEDGSIKTVHIIFNTLGIYNRLVIFQLYEQSITFICNRIVEHMKTLDFNKDYKEFERMLFTVLKIFNPEQHDKFYANYKKECRLKKDKKEFFDIVMDYGIYIHIRPFWHEVNLYDAICQCYEEFPFIKKYDVYFYDPVSCRWAPMMYKQIIGNMYVMKLKQNSKKGLSACSTAPINKRGLPEKTDNAKKHNSVIQKTPVRSGIQETINSFISMNPELIAEMHLLYRSSPVGRRKLGSSILENYGKQQPVSLEIDDKMTNRNVEILASYLKIMGLELVEDCTNVILPTGHDINDTRIYNHEYKGSTYICTPLEMRRIIAKDIAKSKVDGDEISFVINDPVYKEEFMEQLVDEIEIMMDEDGYETYLSNNVVY